MAAFDSEGDCCVLELRNKAMNVWQPMRGEMWAIVLRNGRWLFILPGKMIPPPFPGHVSPDLPQSAIGVSYQPRGSEVQYCHFPRDRFIFSYHCLTASVNSSPAEFLRHFVNSPKMDENMSLSAACDCVNQCFKNCLPASSSVL